MTRCFRHFTGTCVYFHIIKFSLTYTIRNPNFLLSSILWVYWQSTCWIFIFFHYNVLRSCRCSRIFWWGWSLLHQIMLVHILRAIVSCIIMLQISCFFRWWCCRWSLCTSFFQRWIRVAHDCYLWNIDFNIKIDRNYFYREV